MKTSKVSAIRATGKCVLALTDAAIDRRTGYLPAKNMQTFNRWHESDDEHSPSVIARYSEAIIYRSESVQYQALHRWYRIASEDLAMTVLSQEMC